MATVMEMPKLSDTMKEGVIARWLKKEGEKVQAGLPVVEIETDKATMEYEAPSSGTLLKILVNDKESCDLQAPIAVIGKPDENWQEALDKALAKKSGGGKAAAPAAAKSSESAPKQQPQSTSQKPSAPQPAQTSSGSNGGERVKASPLAKKMAQEMGIDVASLQGSGPNGRVVARDLEGAKSSGGAGRRATGTGGSEKIQLSNMRKTIARRLTESVTQAPHFYLTVSINVGPMLEWRKKLLAKASEDKKFSVSDMLIALVARALKRHPEVNASWQGDHIVQYHDVHMGFAVALPNGLMTPVLRNADSLDVVSIAQGTRELIKKAKDGKLQPNDYEGGTFTISNLGMNGIEDFTAIINPPQAAILAVGASIPAPVVDDNGEISVETRMKVTLSCDHRVIDGFVGSEFLKTLKNTIEDPLSALLM